ncbi:SDR family NAD(P)-dependent oxidoreductase [Variovorax boronicumulans]|uniref:SDR family NAD(P)-dependent oxidoreductase n=1 Tax=Variovorax boronicumulans TaxID=436515 RepID=UPI001C597D79
MTRSILIVAAERGLGLGLARQFFERGWHVVGTARRGADVAGLREVGNADSRRLTVATIDVTRPDEIPAFLLSLGSRRFDVAFLNSGIWGAMHQSAAVATNQEVTDIMMTNAFGPIRLAHHLVDRLVSDRPTLAFMTSHRGSTALNEEGGLELYRASKAVLNMLARGMHAQNRALGLTVLSIHPGWARTAMGTLDGAVEPEIELETSVRGVADVVERHMGSGLNLYLDYRDTYIPW